jgi:hypothetical protein
VKSISSSSSSPFLLARLGAPMESSPVAAMAPASSSRAARDPLLFARFDLPAGWGCRKPLAFCREARDTNDAPVASEPAATAAPPRVSRTATGPDRRRERPQRCSRRPWRGRWRKKLPENSGTCGSGCRGEIIVTERTTCVHDRPGSSVARTPPATVGCHCR